MLVSLHLPKTAGSSLRASLREHFGGRLLEDYADLPLNQPRWRRRRRALAEAVRPADPAQRAATCIHGHFLPLKYRFRLPRATFVTWMRDPVERLASHYYHWTKGDRPPEDLPPLRKRVVSEGWDLERFCLAPELRNIYAEFLWGCGIRRFAFVGIVEAYEADFGYFCRRFLGASARPRTLNANPARPRGRYVEDPELRARIEAFHARDLAIYRYALARRRLRTDAA